mmetsp:Transcript_2721/g.5630  ORF Transcript_2721/g.5630 Transcript_2721/m.5630 type:complete len:375 (-) Transcript_2721:568-1692(-)
MHRDTDRKTFHSFTHSLTRTVQHLNYFICFPSNPSLARSDTLVQANRDERWNNRPTRFLNGNSAVREFALAPLSFFFALSSLPVTGFRSFLLDSLLEALKRLLSDQIDEAVSLGQIFLGDVLQILVGTAGSEELGDAHTGAVELTDHERGLVVVHRDPIGSPEEGKGGVGKVEDAHDRWEVLLEGGLQLRILRCIGGKERILGNTSNSREAISLWLLVDDREESVACHLEAHLSLLDARTESLIDQLCLGCTSALEVFSLSLGLPHGVSLVASVDTPVKKLPHGVVLDVVVVHLHQLQLVVILQFGVSQIRAVFLLRQPAEPDALTRRPTVLLDHSGLERRSDLEALLQFLRSEVDGGVGKAAVEVFDLHECLL